MPCRAMSLVMSVWILQKFYGVLQDVSQDVDYQYVSLRIKLMSAGFLHSVATLSICNKVDT